VTDPRDKQAATTQPAADAFTPVGFSVSVAELPGGAVATLLGELDLASAPALREALDEAIAYRGEVEVDMRGCGFVDSMGIATIVSAARRLSETGKALKVKGAQERVSKIFELAGLLDNDWITLEDY
jgi:anti-sigma B factor antagonist